LVITTLALVAGVDIEVNERGARSDPLDLEGASGLEARERKLVGEIVGEVSLRR
jgi:hypothetical protein